MGKLLIRNARYAVTMNGAREVIKHASILIEDEKIIGVGPSRLVDPKADGADVIDADGQIVLPGLINGHYHNNQQLARGLADNTFLPTFLHDRIYPFESAMIPEDTHISSLCACIEAIKTGTTCFADPGGYNMEEVVRAVSEIGIRAVLSRSMIDINTKARPIPGMMRESTDQALAAGTEFVNSFDGSADGRIKAWFSLRTERMVSDEL